MISDFLEAELAHMQRTTPAMATAKAQAGALDEFFRKVLAAASA
jgi:hypothetical protein